MHSKWNHKQDEKTALRMGENNCKWINWQRINPQNIQAAYAAQYQKSKQPNQTMDKDLDISAKKTLWLLFSCQLCSALHKPMDCSTPGLPVPHRLLKFCPSSCPLHQWCHPAISSSDTLFSFCPQSFPALGTFPISQFFTSLAIKWWDRCHDLRFFSYLVLSWLFQSPPSPSSRGSLEKKKEAL